jgi:hypothetical protein
MDAVDVHTEIIISATLNRVAEFSATPDNSPLWYVNIKSVVWKTPGPLSVGSQIAFVAHFMGKKLSYVYEIAEWIPVEKLVMRTANGPFPMETTYIWNIIDEHTTKMSLRNKGNPSGFSKLFAPLMSFMMRRANRKDLKLLKKILESKNL